MGDVDAYLQDQPEPARAAFEHLCALVLEVAPDAEQGTSYGAPAFRHRGRPLLGFTAAKEHLSFFVFDPEINERVRDRLPGFRVTKGLVAFTPDAMPPDDVVRDMVRFRLAALDA
jgi:uncharacterized protein YdhG (YjbR/CyaY superfamily)